MSFNRILKKVPIGSITSGGKEITLSAATQTSNWTRPEVVAYQQGLDFRQAVETSKALIPQGTTEVCQRESDHVSDDTRDHYTAVCFDDKGEGKSVHFPVKRD